MDCIDLFVDGLCILDRETKKETTTSTTRQQIDVLLYFSYCLPPFVASSLSSSLFFPHWDIANVVASMGTTTNLSSTLLDPAAAYLYTLYKHIQSKTIWYRVVLLHSRANVYIYMCIYLLLGGPNISEQPSMQSLQVKQRGTMAIQEEEDRNKSEQKRKTVNNREKNLKICSLSR